MKTTRDAAPENDRFPLPDDVAEYIARAIKSNVRELEGALTRLMAFASLTGATVSLATAQQVLRNYRTLALSFLVG